MIFGSLKEKIFGKSTPPPSSYKINPQERHTAIGNAFKLIDNTVSSDKWLDKYWQAKNGYRAYLAKNHYDDYIKPFENGSEYALPVDMFVYEGDMSNSSINDANNHIKNFLIKVNSGLKQHGYFCKSISTKNKDSIDYCIYLYDGKDPKYNMLFGSKEPKLFSWTK